MVQFARVDLSCGIDCDSSFCVACQVRCPGTFIIWNVDFAIAHIEVVFIEKIKVFLVETKSRRDGKIRNPKHEFINKSKSQILKFLKLYLSLIFLTFEFISSFVFQNSCFFHICGFTRDFFSYPLLP